MDFLLFLLTHSGLRLTRRQYRRIWDHLVGGALCREEMDLCYIWLLRGSIPPHFSCSNDSHYRLYNQQDQRYLFEHCIRRLPAAHLSETGYLLAVSFFCSVNKRAGTLSIRGDKKKLPRRAGDGEGIKEISSSGKATVSALKSKITSSLSNGKDGGSGTSSSSSSPSRGGGGNGGGDGDGSGSNGGGGGDEESYDGNGGSPTRRTRDHLEKFVKNMDRDMVCFESFYFLFRM